MSKWLQVLLVVALTGVVGVVMGLVIPTPYCYVLSFAFGFWVGWSVVYPILRSE